MSIGALAARSAEFRAAEFRAMGSPCELHLYAESDDHARELIEHAQLEIARLECRYSRYRDDSLASEINRSAGDSAGVEVDAETAALLDYAALTHEQSEGLFDITSGVLRQAWDFKAQRLPSPEAIEHALERVGWSKLRWEKPRLVLPIPGMEIDFGGFVKEYAVDRVAELCRQRGARGGLVNLGGDIGVVGPHPDGTPWRLGVRDPRDPERALGSLPLRRGGMASSGDYERFMIIDGVRYSHLLNPRTGWPVVGLAGVSVVAEHCLVAGTATTIAMLKGAEGAAWLDELGLPNLRVDSQGQQSGSLAAPGASGSAASESPLRAVSA